jgi:hypothetical protein
MIIRDSDFRLRTSAGYTILDITDLSNVRYCFIILDYSYSSTEEERALIPIMQPLSITQYVQAIPHFIHIPGEEDCKVYVEIFKDFRLINATALSETWPTVKWDEVGGRNGEEFAADDSLDNTEGFDSFSSGPSSLSNMSLDKVIQESLLGDPESLPRILEHVRDLPAFGPALRKKLYSMPHLVAGSRAAGQLLRNALKDEKTINLSPFNLTEDQVHEILCDEEQQQSILTLSLSGHQNIQESLLKDILNKNKSIRTFHLINTPQIPLQAKLNLSDSVVLFDTELLAEPFLTLAGIRASLPPKPFSLNYIRPSVSQMTFIMCGDKSKRLRRFVDGWG